MADEQRLEELTEQYESGDLDPDQMAWLMWKAEEEVVVLKRKLAAVEKLVADSEEVEKLVPVMSDRIWIQCLREALETK